MAFFGQAKAVITIPSLIIHPVSLSGDWGAQIRLFVGVD
jgi:hypothetical protein